VRPPDSAPFSRVTRDLPRPSSSGRSSSVPIACASSWGYNIFYGNGFQGILRKASRLESGAVIFGYRVQGLCRLDEEKRVRPVSATIAQG